MAGKIALGVVIGCALFCLGFQFRSEQLKAKAPELPFRVVSHVTMGESVDGTPAPYTLVNYERRIQKLIPGVVSVVGEEILISVDDAE